MNANIAAIAYIVSGVLFILALRGLSSPVTSRRSRLRGRVIGWRQRGGKAPSTASRSPSPNGEGIKGRRPHPANAGCTMAPSLVIRAALRISSS